MTDQLQQLPLHEINVPMGSFYEAYVVFTARPVLSKLIAQIVGKPHDSLARALALRCEECRKRQGDPLDHGEAGSHFIQSVDRHVSSSSGVFDAYVAFTERLPVSAPRMMRLLSPLRD